MECSLAALIACFSWSSFYVDGGLSYQDADFPHLEWRTRTYRQPGVTETITAMESIDDPYNPYGRIAFGYEFNFKALTLSAEAFYAGSLDEYGAPSVKGLSLKARWYPFRR